MHPYRTHAAFAAKRLSALFVVVIVLAAVDVPLNAPADVQTAFKRDPRGRRTTPGRACWFRAPCRAAPWSPRPGTELVFGPCFVVPLPEACLRMGARASVSRVQSA